MPLKKGKSRKVMGYFGPGDIAAGIPMGEDGIMVPFTYALRSGANVRVVFDEEDKDARK